MEEEQHSVARTGMGWVRSILWSVLLTVGVVLVMASLRGGPLQTTVPPPLSGVDLSGKPVDIAKLNGKPVVLYFWASWCGACKLTSPTVDQYASSHPEVTVIGVAMDDEANVRAYLKDHERHFPVVVAGEQVQHDWPVRALPTTMVLNKQGQIAWQRVGVLLPFELNLHVE
jgi:thiol-disulfide isomerase/thioredoxin